MIYRRVCPSPRIPRAAADASRFGWRRSVEPRAARPARHKSDDACSCAWPDQWDLDRSGPPQTARTEQLSTTARDQSIWSERARQSSSAKCIRSQTPARCQSRRRSQHVIHDPHPSSCGSICQGIPLRRTKTMPVRHARSETRGRPPCGRGARIRKKGSQDSTTDLGATPRPYAVHATSPTKIRFGRFCYTLLMSLVHAPRSRNAWMDPGTEA